MTQLSQRQIYAARLKPKISAKGSTPLSIIDSTVANYTICGAVWIYPAGTITRSETGGIPNELLQLEKSLELVLSRYPQWCGNLHIPLYDSSLGERDHTRRFGRVHLSWSEDGDPGVDFTVFERDDALESIVPERIESTSQIYNLSSRMDRDLWINSSRIISLRDPKPDTTSMAVKVTLFKDGGVALAVGLHHSLADATSLMTFMKDWSAVHRAVTQGMLDPLKNIPVRPFEPLRLDACAEGDIDLLESDPAIREIALEIPQLRYDFWASNPGRPDIISAPGHPDPQIAHLDEKEDKERGTPIPWDTWDWQAPVKDYMIQWTPDELQRIHEKISPEAPGCSRLDTFLAHLWSCVNRARQVPEDDQVYMDISVGLRNRLGEEPLPSTFLGSPLINVSAKVPSSTLVSSPSTAAREIRKAITETIPRLGALLHHEAYALDPIRMWNAFMGSRHLLVTSWLGNGSEEVDFGFEHRPAVISDMWPIDGLIVLMDEPVMQGISAESGRHQRSTPEGTLLKWYERGVWARVVLTEEVMGRLLEDPSLHMR